MRDDLLNRAERMMEVPLRASALGFQMLNQAMGDSAADILRTLNDLFGSIAARGLQNAAPAGQFAKGAERVRRMARDAEGDERLSLLEMSNRLESWALFQQGRKRYTGSLQQTLADLPDPADFKRPWLLEGIGYAAAGQQTETLIWSEIPAYAHMPLHCGAGIALSDQILRDLDKTDDARATQQLLDFRKACFSFAEPNWVDAVFEGLGLCTQIFHPQLRKRVGDLLKAADQPSYELFRHGVGRALYFAPLNFIPFTREVERGLTECRKSAAEGGPGNIFAGFMWAVTLVNLRTPEIYGRYLDLLKHEEHDAVTAGVMGAMVAWRSCAPYDDSLDGDMAHKAGGLGPKLIGGPVIASQTVLAQLREQGCMGAVFRAPEVPDVKETNKDAE